MPITLVEELALEQAPLRKGIIETLVRESPFVRMLPMETTGTLQVQLVYLSGLPTVSYRYLNESVAEGDRATFAQKTEALSIMEKDINIDPVMLDNKNVIQRLDTAQTRSVTKSIAYETVDLAVNSNSNNDASAPEPRKPFGLKYQMDNESRFVGQTLSLYTGSTPLSLVLGGANYDPNWRKFLFTLDEAIARIDDQADIALMSVQALLNMRAALINLKVLDITRDQFDREVLNYRGVKLVNAGWKASAAVLGSFDAAGSNTAQVIGNDADVILSEGTTIGGGTPSGSVYLIRFGPEHYQGLQQTPIRTKVFGEVADSPHYFRINVRWVLHPACIYQKRAVSRVVGMTFSS